jgi:hypothetical protein
MKPVSVQFSTSQYEHSLVVVVVVQLEVVLSKFQISSECSDE